MSWTRRCLLIAVVGVGGLAPSVQAATWTEIPSNTAEDITAIEYHSGFALCAQEFGRHDDEEVVVA